MFERQWWLEKPDREVLDTLINQSTMSIYHLAGTQAKLGLNSQCAGSGDLLQPTRYNVGSVTSCNSRLLEYTTRLTLQIQNM